MKNAFSRLVAGFLLAAAPFVCGSVWADDGIGSDPVPQVDVWGNLGEQLVDNADKVDGVNDLAQAAQKAIVAVLMDRKHAGELLDKVSETLSGLGIKGGRVLQSQVLKKLAGVVDKLVEVFDFGVAASKAADAWKAGDRAVFNKIVADYLIDIASVFVGQVVEKAVFAFLTGSTCGLGAIPGYAGGAAAGWAAESLTSWLLHKYAQESLENLAGELWNRMRDGDQEQVTPEDLEDLNAGERVGVKDGKNGDKDKSATDYQGVKGIKAHQWGAK